MKKYLLISGIIHVALFIGFIALKNDSNESFNNVVENHKVLKEDIIDDINTPYINEEKEAVMNAISITEEELNEEILKIQQQEELENFDKKQKIEILEKNLEMKIKNIERDKEEQLSELAEEREVLEKERKQFSDLHNQIKDQTNVLSEKERELSQLKREINIKLNENNLVNQELLNNNKKVNQKLENKDMQLVQQSEALSEMESKIAELQTVIAKEKNEKNEILENKTKEEVELLKKELIEYNLTIKNKIEQYWNYQSDQKGISCTIEIIQDENGEILSVSTKECSGDEYFVNSIKEATLKASPLPLPSKDALFSKTINLFFTIK